MYTKILGLPNLNLNISLYGDNLVYMNASNLYGGRYFSKLDLTTNFLNENDEHWTNYNFKHFMRLFSIPKPKLLIDINDINNKYKNVNSELLIKGAHYFSKGTNPWYPFEPPYNFYKQFVTQNFSKEYDIQDNVKKIFIILIQRIIFHPSSRLLNIKKKSKIRLLTLILSLEQRKIMKA